MVVRPRSCSSELITLIRSRLSSREPFLWRVRALGKEREGEATTRPYLPRKVQRSIHWFVETLIRRTELTSADRSPVSQNRALIDISIPVCTFTRDRDTIRWSTCTQTANSRRRREDDTLNQPHSLRPSFLSQFLIRISRPSNYQRKKTCSQFSRTFISERCSNWKI